MIIGRYLGILILFIAAVLQTAMLAEYTFRGGRIDLVLILIICWALFAGSDEAVLWAIPGGLWLDAAGGFALGSSALALVVIGWFAGTFSARRNVILAVVLAGVGTLVYHALLILIFSLTGRPVAIVESILNVTLPSAIVNAAVMLLVYRIFALIFRKAEPYRIGLIES